MIKTSENGSTTGKLPDALRQITSGWLNKIELAKKAKGHFNEVGEQCTSFFQASVSFMWEPDFRRKFLGTSVAPNFHVTLNKAFELVSIYGPTLYWQNPERVLRPRKHMNVTPEMFGVDEQLIQQLQQQSQELQKQSEQLQQGIMQAQQQGSQHTKEPKNPAIENPGLLPKGEQAELMAPSPGQMQSAQQIQKMAQQLKEIDTHLQEINAQLQQQETLQEKHDAAIKKQKESILQRTIRSSLMETWLNYTPGEQPGGGLETAAQKAITESLIKGRGCLMPEAYTMPGGEVKLTGCSYISVDDLFLDPDATGLGPNECWWMAVRRVQPVWYVERKFGLKGKLRSAATYERRSTMGERLGADLGSSSPRTGKTHDTITYYEIWSKAGAGHRLSGMHSEYHDSFEDVGDYVRIVVAPGIDYPLNAPPKKMKKAGEKEIKKMLEWEYPFWKDERWPVVCLDYYHRVPDKDPQSSAWPIAPLEPGLGELITLNVIVSHIVNRTWSSSRDFIGVLQSAHKDVEKWLKKGQDMTVFPVKEIYGDINKVVQWIQQPQMKADMWQVVEMLTQLFEKRVGLSELLYGMTASQSRSAADAETKRSSMNIRPDHMAKQVEQWMEQCARQEKMVARWVIEAKDIEVVLGAQEAEMWEEYIVKTSVEETVREVDCTVAANSVRKPNKEREATNMAQVMSVAMPEFSKHADTTGDTNPINILLAKWGASIDQDMDDFQIGPRTPPPPGPEAAQAAEAQQAAQKQQFDLQMQLLQAKAQNEQVKAQSTMAVEQAKLQGMQMKAEADMAKAQTAQQQAEAKAQLDKAKIALTQLQHQIRRNEAEMLARTREEQHRLEMEIREEQRRQNTADNSAKQSREEEALDHKISLDQEQHDSEMMQDAEKHYFEMNVESERTESSQLLEAIKADGDQDINQSRARNDMLLSRQQAREKAENQKSEMQQKARERQAQNPQQGP